MRAVDAAAPEPVEALVARAGAALAGEALQMLGGAYGRRIVVVAGKGNNGADGRDAARRLRRRGAAVSVLDASTSRELPRADLVIDAAYGTGFRGEYTAPDARGALVLAADIPSGVDGLTGIAGEAAVRADATLTFAALKPGLLQNSGPHHAGRVTVADIGLDVSRHRAALVTDADVASGVPTPQRDDHKYRRAVLAVAGSPGMSGAARLTAAAALRSGAGYVRLCVPGAGAEAGPIEAVVVAVPGEEWSDEALHAAERMKAAAVGPGLGRTPAARAAIRRFVASAPLPLVVDADALVALGRDHRDVLASRRAPTVLTPHDGEYEHLTGSAPSPDRAEAARELARASGAVVLLKGPTTVVASPDGAVRFVTTGSPRLATAGTGDVLTGVVAAFLAGGVEPLSAASLAAHAHGAAARRGHRIGLVASDLLDLLPAYLSDVAGA